MVDKRVKQIKKLYIWTVIRGDYVFFKNNFHYSRAVSPSCLATAVR